MRLYYNQTLPQICARCGAATSKTVEYPFSEDPTKADVVVSLGKQGILGFVMGASGAIRRRSRRDSMGGMLGGALGGALAGALSKSRKCLTLQIPFCEEHCKFRSSRETRTTLMILCADLAMAVALLAVAFAVYRYFVNPPHSVDGWCVIGGGVFLLWYLSSTALYFLWKRQCVDLRWIVPIEVKSQFVVLGGVSSKFAAAVEQAKE